MTLTELMIGTMLMAMIGAGAAALSRTTRISAEQSRRLETEAQVGRVVMDRIRRHIVSASGSTAFPACVVFPETQGGETFPDLLVVWLPRGGPPQNPGGVPLVEELLFLFADPDDPARLIESRIVTDNSPAPATSDLAAWQSLILTATTEDPSASTVEWVELTDSLRVERIGGVARPALRFETQYAPSDQELADYESGAAAWGDLRWPLDLASENAGTRRTTCRCELQLNLDDPGGPVLLTGAAGISFGVTP